MEFSKSAQNRHLTAKNPFFPRGREIWTQYSEFGSKHSIDTFFRLQNVKIGQIDENIRNLKKNIFPIFGQKSPKWILRAKIQKALK